MSSATAAIFRAPKVLKNGALHNMATIARGIHLFPSRTQKLSLLTPMVLGWKRPGRVGSRQIIALLAQLVERAAVNRVVVGSSPTQGVCAGVAELADARDLKSLDPQRSYRFDSGPRHVVRIWYDAGWRSWYLVGLITRRP